MTNLMKDEGTKQVVETKCKELNFPVPCAVYVPSGDKVTDLSGNHFEGEISEPRFVPRALSYKEMKVLSENPYAIFG